MILIKKSSASIEKSPNIIYYSQEFAEEITAYSLKTL